MICLHYINNLLFILHIVVFFIVKLAEDDTVGSNVSLFLAKAFFGVIIQCAENNKKSKPKSKDTLLM